MTRWEDFVERRAITFEQFKKSHGISSKEDFVSVCERLGMEAPHESKLMSLFPPQQVSQEPKVESQEVVNVGFEDQKTGYQKNKKEKQK